MHALIVDDERDIREVARLSLELVGGWVVDVADCGSAAIDQARALVPDVILLDVMMPGIDGVATLHALSQDPATRHIPVVFLTAKAQVGERRRLEEAGACGLIAKPFDPMRLADEVGAILAAVSENAPRAGSARRRDEPDEGVEAIDEWA
ncbi:MAG TPA: response regulator [Acidimicrobiales bacterium]|nr:response regulator [Acidimicrobiales bacterium]